MGPTSLRAREHASMVGCSLCSSSLVESPLFGLHIFWIGPDEVAITASRVCLAAMNPFLKRLLYGTGYIAVNSAVPIRWPDVEADAVRTVLEAIANRGKRERKVPWNFCHLIARFADYLCESSDTLSLVFDTTSKREHLSGMCF